MTEIRRISHSLDQEHWLRAAILALSARVVCRLSAPGLNIPMLVAILVIVSTASSLAFLMPDTLTPLIILCGASFLTYPRGMYRRSVFVCRAIGAFAIIGNLPHLVVALLRIPGSAAGCLPIGRCLFSVLLAALLIPAGIAENTLDKTSVEGIVGHEFAYRALPTAHLIKDGSGLNNFSNDCNALPITTCVLWDALLWTDDLRRMTAANILFGTLPVLGSFRPMRNEDQTPIVTEQMPLSAKALQDVPTSTLSESFKNVLLHGRMFSLDMTLASLGQIRKLGSFKVLESGEFAAGLIARDSKWLIWTTTLHAAAYVLSAMGFLWLLLWPERALRDVRTLVFSGGFAALVCVEIPQPATRLVHG